MLYEEYYVIISFIQNLSSIALVYLNHFVNMLLSCPLPTTTIKLYELVEVSLTLYITCTIRMHKIQDNPHIQLGLLNIKSCCTQVSWVVNSEIGISLQETRNGVLQMLTSGGQGKELDQAEGKLGLQYILTRTSAKITEALKLG